MADPPYRQIRAVHDATTIRVYQAYGDAIADAAIAAGTLVAPPFKLERMTWIKPSFLWMMYRAGWGRKDAAQARILAIDITRRGFDWALANACPSHPDPDLTEADWQALKARSPIRIQWDPERDLHLRPLAWRSLQMGIGPGVSRRYTQDWIVAITDVTALAHEIEALVIADRLEAATARLPLETPYEPLATDQAPAIGP